MGQVASIPSTAYNYYFPPPTPPLLPDPINERDVLSHAAAHQILDSLRERGYCVIRPETETADLVKSCKESVADFFLLPLEDKKVFESPENPDPLLKGRRANRGFVQGKSKEYLKIRMIDKETSYPTSPTDLQDKFSRSMKAMSEISINALYALGDVPVDESNTDNNGWLDIKATDNVKSFIPEGSSVSVIKYFQIDGDTEDDHEPLGEHVDTGIMTLIRVSEVQGLQVYDQLHKKYLNVEEIGQVGDMVLIMGRKIEFLLHKDVKLTPTVHRVIIPKNKERFSILFFMDLPGGKDT